MRIVVRIAAAVLGLAVALGAMWLSLVALLVGTYAFDRPDPTIPDGDPCCSYADSWTEVVGGFAGLAVAMAVVGALLGTGVRLVHWALTGRSPRWPFAIAPVVVVGVALAAAACTQAVRLVG